MTIQHILQQSPLLPVIILHDIAHAEPLAHALYKGGITALEITLRTPVGLKAIEQLTRKIPNMLIGAGTVTTPEQLIAVKNAGAGFAISPGINSQLIETAQKINLPYLPAVCTPSDILLATQHQLLFLKFFPANLFGGINALKNFSILFPNIRFCPTGGIDMGNLADYLKLTNVISVGGSWLTPQTLIEKKDWSGITQLAATAVAAIPANRL